MVQTENWLKSCTPRRKLEKPFQKPTFLISARHTKNSQLFKMLTRFKMLTTFQNATMKNSNCEFDRGSS